MKALEKMFQKNVSAMVVVLMAIGLTTLLPSWTADGGPGKDNSKGKKVKTEVKLKGLKNPTTTVNRGVLAEEATRYRITAGEPASGHSCGGLTLPCTISFNNAVNVPYQEGGNWYVNKGAGISVTGMGPYIAP